MKYAIQALLTEKELLVEKLKNKKTQMLMFKELRRLKKQ